jgi:hypothetical protein
MLLPLPGGAAKRAQSPPLRGLGGVPCPDTPRPGHDPAETVADNASQERDGAVVLLCLSCFGCLTDSGAGF